MIIEKLDGFTADGAGKVIGGEKDLVDGDVQRITRDDKTVIETRFYKASEVQPGSPPPDPMKQLLSDIAAIKAKIGA